jgi:catechol 2,3-dioxygenase-like lactoylglutathione lyase family enzyme
MTEYGAVFTCAHCGWENDQTIEEADQAAAGKVNVDCYHCGAGNQVAVTPSDRSEPSTPQAEPMPAAAAKRIRAIHHINFPTTNIERTKEWYGKVFGMKHVDVSRMSDTNILLMTAGHCDLHFTPIAEPRRMDPFHFAIEIEDWGAMLAHLKAIGVRHTKPFSRPQNNSTLCYLRDPDGTLVELTYHANRQ